MPQTLTRVMLVEDHEITRLGLKMMLEQIDGIEVVAEAADGKTCIDTAITVKPDLILMDIGLPGVDGIEATKAIKDALQTKIIVITSHESEEDVLAGLAAGADAYCLKGVSFAQLSNAISAVRDGAIWLDPGIAREITRIAAMGKAQSTQKPSENAFHLSARECEVLSLLVEGLTNRQIAERLILSCETVKTHMRHIMEKLCVADRTQAAVKAVRQGIVRSPGKTA
jgi:two-component system, NarL family, response regulator LiaR